MEIGETIYISYFPTIIGPEERDLTDISLSHDQEGFTTPSTKSVFVATENCFSFPRTHSVSVTRIPVNKYRLITIFHCRVHGREIAPHGWSLE